MKSQFLNEILAEVSTFEKFKTFRGKIKNDYVYDVKPYVDSKNYVDLYFSFLKWAWLTLDELAWNKIIHSVCPIHALFVSSPDEEDDLALNIKKIHRKELSEEDIKHNKIQVESLSDFFVQLYELANSLNYTWKSEGWANFWKDLSYDIIKTDIEKLSSISDKSSKLKLKRKEKRLSYSQEEYDISEYSNDELESDYIKIFSKLIPNIVNEEEFAGILNFFAIIESVEDSDIESIGLIDSLAMKEKEKLFKRKIGTNNLVEEHLRYALIDSLLHSAGYTNLAFEIEETIRYVLAAPSEIQEDCINSNKITFLEKKEKVLLKFFFKDMYEVVNAHLEAMQEKTKLNTLEIYQMVDSSYHIKEIRIHNRKAVETFLSDRKIVWDDPVDS